MIMSMSAVCFVEEKKHTRAYERRPLVRSRGASGSTSTMTLLGTMPKLEGGNVVSAKIDLAVIAKMRVL